MTIFIRHGNTFHLQDQVGKTRDCKTYIPSTRTIDSMSDSKFFYFGTGIRNTYRDYTNGILDIPGVKSECTMWSDSITVDINGNVRILTPYNNDDNTTVVDVQCYYGDFASDGTGGVLLERLVRGNVLFKDLLKTLPGIGTARNWITATLLDICDTIIQHRSKELTFDSNISYHLYSKVPHVLIDRTTVPINAVKVYTDVTVEQPTLNSIRHLKTLGETSDIVTVGGKSYLREGIVQVGYIREDMTSKAFLFGCELIDEQYVSPVETK